MKYKNMYQKGKERYDAEFNKFIELNAEHQARLFKKPKPPQKRKLPVTQNRNT